MPHSDIAKQYQPVIGLEIHIQLQTRSKMFATEAFSFGQPPNHCVSPISLAHPGALPSINQAAVSHAIRLGLALGCTISEQCFFDRKNYFYPDLPKGYQISQDQQPICIGGKLAIRDKDGSYRDIRIHHIHIEEDAGKSVHDQDPENSLIDLNRAGVGLLELVTEPDLRTPEEAAAFMSEIRTLVRYLEVCDGDMEKGSLRCDANVSVMKKEATEFGPRVEIKNMNSFNFITKAAHYEIGRQIDELEDGGSIQQETRLWDTVRERTQPMREKETADDYRYFPEPDLLPLHISQEEVDKARKSIPRLPQDRFREYHEQLGISYNEAAALVEERAFSDYFESVRSEKTDGKEAAKWMMGPVRTWIKEQDSQIAKFPLNPSQLARLIDLVQKGTVSKHHGRGELFDALVQSPSSNPLTLAEEKGLMIQATDSRSLENEIATVLREFPDEVARYQKGKKALLG
ncbi:MAG: Asp-tRNA(Asn)/Glu-tRNA(Gln) amidotransferase subunit GatB, partial [Bacteroidota bacterium]